MFQHQGDVLLVKVSDEVPSKRSKQKVEMKNGRAVIQHGEALGHYHTVDPAFVDIVNIQTLDSIKELTLNVYQDTTITHEEHKPLVLTKGVWKVRTQRESMFGRWKEVLD